MLTGPKIVLARYTAASAEGLIRMQAEVLNALPDPELLVKTTDEEWRNYLLGDGIIFVAKVGAESAAYGIGVLGACADEERRYLTEEIANEFNLLLADFLWVDTVAVLPRFRGQGIQRLLTACLEKEGLSRGASVALTSVSPENEHSLRNFVSSGYIQVRVATLYGGRKRLVLANHLARGGTENRTA